MSSESIQCGRRSYTLESNVTKNGHKFVMITEKSFGRQSKVMVFHDHFQIFRDALDRALAAEPAAPEQVLQ